METWLICETFHDEIEEWTTFAQGPWLSEAGARASGEAWLRDPGEGISEAEYSVSQLTREQVMRSYSEVYVIEAVR